MNRTLFARFFAPRDPIEQQLSDLAHQGSGMSRVAHLCATLLVVLFSAGSLVALGSDALTSILKQWNASHTIDIPSAISVAVSTLLVLCMDTGMLYAASMLRVLAARRAGIAERWIHVAVMGVVSILEAGTYAYMSYRFEAPASAAAQALILARALAAPMLAVYLSMARPLPITSRDIMSQVELASGRGLLRDSTIAANDSTAPLARKMKLYSAAAVMLPADRARLDAMIGAVIEEQPESTSHNTQALLAAPSESALVRTQEGAGSPDPDRGPTGPGSPTQAPQPLPGETGVRTPGQPIPIRRTPERQTRKTAARHKQNAEARVRSVWRPGITITEIERRAHVSRSTGHKWNRVLIGEQQQAVR